MKKYTVLGIGSLCLVVFFQNCGKAPNTQESTITPGISANQQYNKYSASGYSTLSVWDYLKNRFLDVNLKTGEIIAFEEAGEVRGETYQLPAEKLAQVNGILQGAEICEPIINPEELAGRMCTMAYRYPHSILVDQGEEVRLGEKTDGCDIPTDLCGEKAVQLRSFSRALVESL